MHACPPSGEPLKLDTDAQHQTSRPPRPTEAGSSRVRVLRRSCLRDAGSRLEGTAMRMHSLSSRSRAVACGTAAVLASVSAVAGSSVTAAAHTNAGVQGSLSVFAVPGTFGIQQLSTGSDGKLWFVTPQSQLGTISTSGQAALTGVVLPHGNVSAVIAGAGPEGVWSYGQNDTAIYSKGSCVLDLVTSDNVVHPVT